MQKRGGRGPPRCSTRPPTTCTPSHRRPPLFSPGACLLAPDGDRGWKTHPDSRQRSDFSLGMSQGFGHKSRRIHIYQTGARFCPAGKEGPERALQQTSPSWGALSGAAKRLSPRPFECCPPATSHARLRAQTLTCAHTHSTLPSTFSRMAAYNAPGPHQTESPAAPFEK